MTTAWVGRAASISLLALSACGPAEPTRVPVGLASPFTGYASARYADDRLWLCRPDLPNDPCRTDLTETEVRADGSRVIVRHVPADKPAVDCFYVYPTVDMGFFASNHEDFSDREPMAKTAIAQVAHFSEVCAVYAPLYRQVSIGSYLTWASRRDAFLSVAFSDVEDAFLDYMARFNRGRPVVLIGHSQGAEMVVRLLKKRFDNDPAMRDKLVVAMPIGGAVEVAPGHTTGGSFTNIPVCTRIDEKGCVVAYRTYRAGQAATAGASKPSAGRESACVNPPGDGYRFFSRAIFPFDAGVRKQAHGLDGVDTPFVSFGDYFAGRCVEGAGGFRYLEVGAAPRAGDMRVAPLDLSSWTFGTQLGLHILDMQFAQGDLIELVRRKASAR